MSESPIAPENVDQLRRVVADEQRVIAVGNQTKRPLSHCGGVTQVSLRRISGITQYEPSEFTFTAMAGTPLAEIIAALDEKQQYLPFDPMLVDTGATIGGTVAAGLSGPGRFRYGGIRDFLLAVYFISGDNKVIRSGGKVVKNAAGFDIPKFMVGSLGRFGVMTELTFKVFPRPAVTQTLGIQCESHAQAFERMSLAGGATWELDAIDYHPDHRSIYIRIGGPEASNKSITHQILAQWGSDVFEPTDADEYWQNLRELTWSDDLPIAAKIPVTPQSANELCGRLPGTLLLSAAANVAWQFLRNSDQVAESSKLLSELELTGLVVKGPIEISRIGDWASNQIEISLKNAFDPTDKYPPMPRSEGKA